MHAIAQLRLVDQACVATLTAIWTHELAPGERLTQDEPTDRLNVSRQAIQQTLLALEKQGFLQRIGRRGLMVGMLDAGFVRHVYQVRVLESGCGEPARATAPA